MGFLEGQHCEHIGANATPSPALMPRFDLHPNYCYILNWDIFSCCDAKYVYHIVLFTFVLF